MSARPVKGNLLDAVPYPHEFAGPCPALLCPWCAITKFLGYPQSKTLAMMVALLADKLIYVWISEDLRIKGGGEAAQLVHTNHANQTPCLGIRFVGAIDNIEW